MKPRPAHALGAREDLPASTVTFLFTDVEGSTKLLDELGAEDYAQALAEHRRIVRESCTRLGGAEVDTQGDAFFFAFPTAPDALEASRAIVEGLSMGRIALRNPPQVALSRTGAGRSTKGWRINPPNQEGSPRKTVEKGART